MEILTILILVGIAILLLLVEIFLIPGLSIAGLGALGCSLYAIYYAFINLGIAGGFITLIITLIAGALAFRAFMRSKTLDKLSLKKNIDSKIDRQDGAIIEVGDLGVSTTRLALFGLALFDNKTIEVKSIEGFIDENTPIQVVRITDGNILVQKLDDKEKQ